MGDNNGKYIFGVVKVGDKGQIVIPKDARKKYDIKPGVEKPCVRDPRSPSAVDPRKQV